MAKIKVQGYDTRPYKGRVGSDVGFSLVSSPKDGRRQVIGFMGCKAFVHDAVQAHVLKAGDSGGHYYNGKSPPIDMDKLRLLVGTNSDNIKKYKKKLFAAKRMVNLFEEAAEWKPSKIATVEHSDISEGVWLITGPKQWMRSPQMLSMIMLIIRAAVRNGPANPKDEKGATKLLKKWAGNAGGYGDRTYLHSSWDKLFLIAKNYEKLFGGLTVKQRYNSGDITSHSNGIANWCEGRAGFAELNTRLKKLCKEHGIKLVGNKY